jgi:uroporphyrinogen decarboxylase
VGSAKMTSKERVMSAFAHTEADRVPIDYSSNPGIDSRLKGHFGLSAEDDEGLLQALKVDFRTLNAGYTGPRLHAELPDRQVDARLGIVRRYVEHDSGGYWDYCDFPLKDATEDQVAAWPLPDPENYDYAGATRRAQEFADYAVGLGGAGICDTINCNGMLRTMEQTLVDLATDDPAGLLLADRRQELQLKVLRRTLEACHGAIDYLYIGEDLGTQVGPMISPDMYRQHLKPRHKKFADLGRDFGLPVMIHSCGSSSWAFEDFIEIGITVVDTLQPEAADMSPAYLKEKFGHSLAFHGCISTAGPLAYGTPAEVISSVGETLAIMKPGGGYCLAPTHQMQDNTPTENAVAMYQAALQYGEY